MRGSVFLLILIFVAQSAFAQTTAIVYFDFNSAVLKREARNTLDKIAASKVLNSVGLFGHTDQVGTDEQNEWLSLERARVVRDYLLKKNFPANKFSVVLGFGATRIIADGPDEMSRQLNRRVVIMNAYKPTRLDADIAAQQATITTKPTETIAQKPIVEKPLPAKINIPIATSKAEPSVKKEEPVVKQQKNEKLVEDIRDKSTLAGEHIILKNINFHPGKSYFLEVAIPSLQGLVEAMQSIKTLKIEIQGHVCCTDDNTDALDVATGIHNLSVTRAKAVYDYLVQKGIEESRISFKGLAHQYPLVKVEATEQDRIANRRVEIKILSK